MKSVLIAFLLLQCASASRVRGQDTRLVSGNATQDLKDADAIAKGVEATAKMDFEDAAAIRRAASLENHRARAELEGAAEDEKDSKAISKADKLWARAQDTQGEKDLKDAKDLAALKKAVDIKVKMEDKDAAQMDAMATKEKADGNAQQREALRMDADADMIERKAMGELEQEGADVKALRAAAAAEAGRRSCSAKVTSPESSLTEGIPNMAYGEVKFCDAGQLKKVEGSCPDGAAFDAAAGELFSNGGMSECQTVTCSSYPCCMGFTCGGSNSAWAR